MNSFASFGLPVGIMVGLVLVVIFLKYINRDKKIKTEYDERQKIARGRSYTYGFYALVISNVIMLVVGATNDEIIRILGMNAFFAPLMIGIIVQISHAIFNDCYMGLNNNLTRYMVVMTFISIFNFVCGIVPLVKDGFIQNGKLYISFINLEVGVMFIIICIEMGIKKAIDKREDEE